MKALTTCAAAVLLLCAAGCWTVLDDLKLELSQKRIESTENVALAYSALSPVLHELERQRYELAQRVNADARRRFWEGYANDRGEIVIDDGQGGERPINIDELEEGIDKFVQWQTQVDRIHRETTKQLKEFDGMMIAYTAAMAEVVQAELEIDEAKKSAEAAALEAARLVGSVLGAAVAGGGIAAAF